MNYVIQTTKVKTIYSTIHCMRSIESVKQLALLNIETLYDEPTCLINVIFQRDVVLFWVFIY